MKTSELTGPALDWAVAKCEREDYSPVTTYNGIGQEFPPTNYSTDWAQGGPIIEREGITTAFCSGDLNEPHNYWTATAEKQGWQYGYSPYHEQDEDRSLQIYKTGVSVGPTPLIAAMRCYVALKLGDDIEVPPELK